LKHHRHERACAHADGASAEGTLDGSFNEVAMGNGMPYVETPEFLLSKIDDFGTPTAYNHYAVGWAHAMCTPYQWTKQIASHWGGTRNGTIVHWPNGIADKGKTRNQFHHVIDTGSPTSPDYGPTDNHFNGQIDWVRIDIGGDSHDDLIKPEGKLTAAMARQ
jgi:hypothetical protein